MSEARYNIEAYTREGMTGFDAAFVRRTDGAGLKCHGQFAANVPDSPCLVHSIYNCSDPEIILMAHQWFRWVDLCEWVEGGLTTPQLAVRTIDPAPMRS